MTIINRILAHSNFSFLLLQYSVATRQFCAAVDEFKSSVSANGVNMVSKDAAANVRNDKLSFV